MDEILYNYLLVKNNGLATYGYTGDGRAIKSFLPRIALHTQLTSNELSYHKLISDVLTGTDAKAKCVPTKDKDSINVYGAMTGYDIIQV